jgi:hypothetical protein
MQTEHRHINALDRSRQLEGWFQSATSGEVPRELVLKLANLWGAITRSDNLLEQMICDADPSAVEKHLVGLDVYLFDELGVHLEALRAPLTAFLKRRREGKDGTDPENEQPDGNDASSIH